MDLSIFLARWIGLYLLILAGLWVIHKDQMDNAMKDMLSSTGLVAFSGVMSLLFGLGVAVGHPVWEWSWRVVVTLLGYHGIVKGVVLLVYPKQVKDFSLKVMGKWFVSFMVFMVVLGVYLTYNGFAH
jgi:hypothetical protein